LLLRRNAIILLVPALGVFAPSQLTGQLAVEVSAGARYTTAVVHDSIVTPFDVRPALAPAVAVTLAAPLEHGYAAQVTFDFSTSELQRQEADGSSVDLGRTSTAALTVGLERQLPAGFSAQIGVGGIKYFGESSGIFRLGSGSIAGLGALTLAHTLPLGGHYGFTVEARYDVHGFTTPALREEGFDSPLTVHRVALSIRAKGRGPK
jgi:hypothetical protein